MNLSRKDGPTTSDYSHHPRTSNNNRPSSSNSAQEQQWREGPDTKRYNSRRDSSKERHINASHPRQHWREERRHAPYHNPNYHQHRDDQARNNPHGSYPVHNRPYNKPDHHRPQQQHQQQPHSYPAVRDNYSQHMSRDRDPPHRSGQQQSTMRQDIAASGNRYYGGRESSGGRGYNLDSSHPRGNDARQDRRHLTNDRHDSERYYGRHNNDHDDRPASNDHNSYPSGQQLHHRGGQYHHHRDEQKQQEHQNRSRRYEEETKNDGWETVPSNKRSSRRRDQQAQGQSLPPSSSSSSYATTGYTHSTQTPVEEKPFIPNFIPPKDANNKDSPQFMLLLVGIPGSGKSTFAQALEVAMPYKYVRINQDTLGSRQYCEEETRRVLREGKCPVIDRCNFDLKQRKHFLDIASRANVHVDAVVFTYPLDVCLRRCEARTNHQTIKPGEALPILERMIQQFSPPLPNRINAEKFRNLRNIVGTTQHNDVVAEYLNAI